MAGLLGDEGVGVGEEGGDVFRGGVPAAHKAVAGGASEVIEMPTAGGESGGEGIVEAGENGVGGGLGAEGDAGNGAKAGGELAGHGVGVGGVAKPGAGFEEAHPLGAEETHFGSKLAGLFAAVFELAGESGLEKTTASVVFMPFLVPPKHRTSTPARQVKSAGETLSRAAIAAAALAKRAPSMWTARPWAWAVVARAAISARS